MTNTISSTSPQHKAQQQLELIINYADEAIYGIDMNGDSIFVNNAVAQMVGLSMADTANINNHEVVHHHYPDGRPYPIETCLSMSLSMMTNLGAVMMSTLGVPTAAVFPLSILSVRSLIKDNRPVQLLHLSISLNAKTSNKNSIAIATTLKNWCVKNSGTCQCQSKIAETIASRWFDQNRQSSRFQ